MVDLGPGQCTTSDGFKYKNNVLFEDKATGCVYLCKGGMADAFKDAMGMHRGCSAGKGNGGPNNMGGMAAMEGNDNLALILGIAGAVGCCLLILIVCLVLALLFGRQDDEDEDEQVVMMQENSSQQYNTSGGGTWKQYGQQNDMPMDGNDMHMQGNDQMMMDGGGAYEGGGQMGTEGFLARPPPDVYGMDQGGGMQFDQGPPPGGGFAPDNQAVNAYLPGPDAPPGYGGTVNTDQFAMAQQPGDMYSPHGLAAPGGGGGNMYVQ
mmetsp:Transcript_902/g.2056  ORF Transcript_902/g.2056 Transcript_902/m.2056 type:complete len:264 (-) Transcript_902:164-955(-)